MRGGELIGAEKENVVIRSADCALTLLPAFGGKIASIRVKDRELLQKPLAPIAPRTRTMAFDAGDASGWDECVPSVAGCTIETAEGPAVVPDHGDLWREAWTVAGDLRQGIDEGAVTLEARCFSVPLTLSRSIAIGETDKGWWLKLDYRLTNTGHIAVPWSWAAHPLFAVEEGDRVELPASIRALRVEGSAGERLGRGGTEVSWPMAALAGGGTTDLRRVAPESAGIGDKLFTGRLRAEENWCVLHRPKAGLRIRFRFDAEATPYLGLWLCYGGWPERAGAKQMCVAMEPSTAPVDSLAKGGEWTRVLEPGASFSWPLTVEIEAGQVEEHA